MVRMRKALVKQEDRPWPPGELAAAPGSVRVRFALHLVPELLETFPLGLLVGDITSLVGVRLPDIGSKVGRFPCRVPAVGALQLVSSRLRLGLPTERHDVGRAPAQQGRRHRAEGGQGEGVESSSCRSHRMLPLNGGPPESGEYAEGCFPAKVAYDHWALLHTTLVQQVKGETARTVTPAQG